MIKTNRCHRRSLARRLLLATMAATALTITAPSALSAPMAVVTGFPHTPATSNGVADIATTLAVKLPKGNRFDDAIHRQLDGYIVHIWHLNGVDISTHEGYEAAAKLSESEIAQRKGEATSVTTNAEGIAAFPTVFPAGAYYVEIEPPSRPNAYTFRPMLLILPVIDDNGQWAQSLELEAKPQPELPTTTPETTTPKTTTPGRPPTTKFPPPPRVPGRPPTVTRPPGPSVTTTLTTTPAVPGQPPETPNVPQRAGTPTLAVTGASVLGIALLGTALVIGGALSARRGKPGTDVQD